MDCLQTFLLLLILAVSSLSADFPCHKVVLKTIRQAQHECKQYLLSGKGSLAECEPRCIELVLRSWNDSNGLQSVPFERHFQPDIYDTNYVNRTQQCLDRALGDISGDYSCCQASAALQCYRNQYGNIVHKPQLVPMPDLLIAGVVDECARILEISPLEVSYGASVNFDLSDKTRKLLRCSLIRMGLYNDVAGPDLDRIYVQCDEDQVDELAFRQNARDCVDRLRAECTDNSTLATRIATQCFPDGCSPLSIVQNALSDGATGATTTTTSTTPASDVSTSRVKIDAIAASILPIGTATSTPSLSTDDIITMLLNIVNTLTGLLVSVANIGSGGLPIGDPTGILNTLTNISSILSTIESSIGSNPTGSGVITVLLNLITGLLDALTTLVSGVPGLQSIAAAISSITSTISSILSMLNGNSITSIVPGTGSSAGLPNLFSANPITSLLPGAGSSTGLLNPSSLLNNTNLSTGTGTAASSLPISIYDALATIYSLLYSVGNNVLSIVYNVSNGLPINELSGVLNTLLATINSLLATLQSSLDRNIHDIGVVTGLLNAITGLLKIISGFVSGVPGLQSIAAAISSINSTVSSITSTFNGN